MPARPAGAAAVQALPPREMLGWRQDARGEPRSQAHSHEGMLMHAAPGSQVHAGRMQTAAFLPGCTVTRMRSWAPAQRRPPGLAPAQPKADTACLRPPWSAHSVATPRACAPATATQRRARTRRRAWTWLEAGRGPLRARCNSTRTCLRQGERQAHAGLLAPSAHRSPLPGFS